MQTLWQWLLDMRCPMWFYNMLYVNDNNYCLCRKLNELQCQSENEVASELSVK